MSDDPQFIYKEEYWYISAFIDTLKINGVEKSQEIELLIKEKFKNLTEDDIYKKELKDDILEMVKHIFIKCRWVSYLTNFPYREENSEVQFNALGYFQFEVEHFKEHTEKKEKLTPMLIQQIPFLVLEILKEFDIRESNKGLFLDLESPIYVFATSNRIKPRDVEWTQENIEKYKKSIAYWTVIYSGQWDDYSENLYNRRVENNLSNRLSELHFIRRNSGFIYMAEENYTNFFDSYMKEFVLEPTPRMRSVLFALRSINESLDLLFLKTQSEGFMDLETIESKIRNLRLLRGLIQTKLSMIYNELDYNRREHYTSVLKHLLKEFEINKVVNRINQKFEIIYDAMQELYRKHNEALQERTEKGLNLLNLLFGAGILADLTGVIMIALSIPENSALSSLLNGIISLIILGILISTTWFFLYIRIQKKKKNIGKTVDAIIEDNDGNIVLIKRKYPPFQNYYALPGGFVEKGEKPSQALIREIKEETNLDVKIEEKIGIYDAKGRDPRGNIHSTTYKCSINGDTSKMVMGDDSSHVELISIKKLRDISLAFDHKQMLKDANIMD
ncbi:MAG: NUDIX domain-containing protein [Promethearchaeota archaeon]